MSKANLLIVEDELVTTLNIRNTLTKQGFIVVGSAVNGEDAVKMALELSPDLILMDIILEGPIDGIETARRIRQLMDVPFIYLTAHADNHTIERTRDTMPSGFLNKPFNERDLYINIDSAIYKHKMERRLRANEEKYRTLVENISDIVFSTDENGILMYISPRINDMCGYTEYEMIGQKLTNYIHDEDRQRLIELIEKKQRSVHAEEFRLVTKSGDIKWVSWSSSPIITGTVFNGRRGIITDISMQMQAKKIVKKNERFLDAIFNSIQDGILVLDKDYTIIKVNQTMNAWYRHMIPLKGKRCFEAYHGRAEPCEICPTSKAFTSGKLEMDNIPLVTAKGQTGWLELFSFPMMDENGRVTGVVEYVKDITKRKQAEELIRMQRDLVQALSATSDLGEALSMSIDTAIRASGMDSGSVYLVNHKTGGADLAFHTGLGRHFIEKASHYHADSPFSRLVMSRKPVYNFNEELCLSPETFMVNEGIRAIAFIPIVSKDRVVACMNIASHIHDEIPVEFRNTLENIPMQIGGIITRLEIQESLKTSEEKFRLMIENSPYAIAIMDDADIISYINKTFTEVLGYTAEDIAAGEAWWDRAFPDVSYRKKIMGAGKKTAQKRGTRGIAASESQELTTICKDGSIKLIDYRVVSIGGNSFIFMNDLTEKMKTQEMMIHNEKMTSLGRLAAGMAHDINNPLSIILQGIQGILTRISKKNKINRDAAKRLGVNLDAMLAYMKKREIIEYLGGMNDAGQRAAKIVSNMLLFSRKSETDISPVDLNALIDKIVELASHDYDIKKKFDFRKITIKRFYDRNLPPVPCSETGIGQVIFNLLKNSSQAMSAVKVKAKEPVITIRTWRENGLAVMEISDNGPGMDAKVQRRIFEPFYTTKGPGTGLGLSVSYYIITRNHNGSIGVKSQPGEGAAFTVKLPLKRKRP